MAEENNTPTTPVEQLRIELQNLKSELKSQNELHKKELDTLKSEIRLLKQVVSKNEDKLCVQGRVNDALSNEVDRLEQYGRRNCILLKGLTPARNEKNEELTEKVKNIISHDLNLPPAAVADFDKTHRVGPIFKDKKGNLQQTTIIRFKSHEARYKAYLKRGIVKNKGLNLTPSLTNKRRKLLDAAIEKYGGNDFIEFIFCDIHGDLKVKLCKAVRNNHFHIFKSLENIQWLLHDLSEQDFDDDVEDES